MTEKYIPNGRPLTDHEREILTILSEECAEVIQAVSKILRFGVENHPGKDKPNNHHLGIECGELEYMMSEAQRLGLIRTVDITDGRLRKAKNLDKYLQTQPE